MRTITLLFALIMWGISIFFGQTTAQNDQQKAVNTFNQEFPGLLSPDGKSTRKADFDEENLNLHWEPVQDDRMNYYVENNCNYACVMLYSYVAGAAINGENMGLGDEIGVFDGNVLVGNIDLDQVCTPENQFENPLHALTVKCNGEPGYSPGNPVSFRAWDESESTEYFDFELRFHDPYGDAWAEPFFPAGDGQYSIITLEFTSGDPTGTLAGTVKNIENDEPIEGVFVDIGYANLSDTTDAAGSFEIDSIPPGTYSAAFSHPYYYTNTVNGIVIMGWETTIIDAFMEPKSPELLEAIPGPGQITLTWEAIGAIDDFQYELNYSQGCANPVWTIFIQSAKVNGIALIAGEEIGVFDGDLMVGYYWLEQVCTPENQFENNMLAWDIFCGGDDGYNAGNPVTFKAQVHRLGIEVVEFEAEYLDPYGDAWTEPFFPEGDTEYSIVALDFYTDMPQFNVYYDDGTFVDGPIEDFTYTDMGLEGGEEYCYTIRQILDNGMLSAPSNIKCATPTEIVAPELTHIEREVEALTLVWEPYLENSRINYFDFVGGTGGPIWTIFLAHASIDDADMVAGDEVAVFDGDLMVGAFTLTQVCTPENQYENDMPAFSELTTGDGYTPGNAASFKGWDESEMMEVSQFNLNFLDPNGDAWMDPVFPPSDGPYSIVELEFSASQYDPSYNVYYADGTQIAEGIEAISHTDENLEGGEEYCYYVTQIFESGEESEPSNVLCGIPYGNQTIALEDNYSFVSSYIVPFNPDLMDLLPDVLDNLDMVRSQSGNTLQKIGPNWVNNIGDWVSTQGYLFHMDAPDTLIMEGEVIAPTTPISLEYGYSFAGYLPKTGMNAMNAFETIIGDSLELIRNDNGNSIQKVGPNWINNIGDALPGEGYLVRMLGSGELVYPGNAKGYQPGKSLPSANSIGNPADPVYAIYIDPGKGLEAGDKILALEGDKVVGSVEITSGNWETNELPAFSTLNDGKGYQPGHPFKLAVERNGKLIELNHRLQNIHDAYTGNTYPEGDGIYSIAKVSMSITGQEEKDHRVNIFPNPATDKVYISSSKSINSVKLYHASGKALIFEKGLNSQRYELDVSLFSPGIYILEIENAGSRIRTKLVVQ